MSTRGLVGKINTPRVAAVRSLAAPIDVTLDYLNRSVHFLKIIPQSIKCIKEHQVVD